MTTTCVKCGEALIAPDWSEFVSERLVLNLWTCTKCGDRFETKAYTPADVEPKMRKKIGRRCFLRCWWLNDFWKTSTLSVKSIR